MKILNLYCGIGGNRRLWGDEHDMTAVEYNPKIAKEYKENFPNDTVVIADAHNFILENHKNFDFIWSSPPCQSHSTTNYFTQHIRKIPVFPSMKLYEEILFLKHFFKGKWVVENVIPYYQPMIEPTQKIGRHLFWSNFNMTKIKQPKDDIGTMIKGHKNAANKKRLEERNAVNGELGLHILELAQGIIRSNNPNQTQLF